MGLGGAFLNLNFPNSKQLESLSPRHLGDICSENEMSLCLLKEFHIKKVLNKIVNEKIWAR